jgi:DNA-binding CsgD family transcriptional regulator
LALALGVSADGAVRGGRPTIGAVMHLSTNEQTALSRVFGLLADDLAEREIRTRLGQALVDLLRADHFASFVWDEPSQRFGNGVWLAMDASNLARYDDWFQYNDPITFALQARRHATLVSEVMPHRALQRTEFFSDFLARDGLHWGINLHAFDGGRALGDLRIWRGKHRREFEPHDKALLDLIEPAFIAALKRSQPAPSLSSPASDAASVVSVARAAASAPSPRELAVARCVARGLTDKQIARELGLAVSSVRTYLGRLAQKAGVQRRAGLAQWAAQWAAQAEVRIHDEPLPGA